MREAHTMMTTRVSKKDDFKQNLRQLKNVVDPGYLVESRGFNFVSEYGL
jgi:hypothetical protein